MSTALPPYKRENSLPNEENYTLPPRAPPYDVMVEYLSHELSFTRYDDLATLQRLELWGHTGPVHALHEQEILERKIVTSSNINLHLVRYKQRIYLKPLPACILNYDFFQQNVCDTEAYKMACGLLRSYTKLVANEVDLRLATKHLLIPPGISWEKWCTFAVDLSSIDAQDVHERYTYGELKVLSEAEICLLLGENLHSSNMSTRRFRTNLEGVSVPLALSAISLTALQMAAIGGGFNMVALCIGALTWAILSSILGWYLIVSFPALLKKWRRWKELKQCSAEVPV